ncbi:MAG: serine hydrolase [Gammaproteobacteria bacterium]|nr:serine hydrolase [Gammaproteobacteria bacterium]
MIKSLINTIICTSFSLWFVTLYAQKVPSLPISLKEQPSMPLYERIDAELQLSLDKRLSQNNDWQQLINQQKMAVALVDLSKPENPKYARINGRKTMYSASMPKIAILLAVFQKIDIGEFTMTPAIKKDLTDMIRRSSNRAATRMINQAGGLDNVNKILTDPRYRLYDKNLGGGLWVGKRYQQVGRRVPDPVYGISHGSSVMQVARFYYLLATGRLINPQRSREMLDILVDPAIKHKFVVELEKADPNIKIYRKSGTWKNWHADSVLVWGPVWRRYILVSIVESVEGEKILRNLLPAIESILEHP